MKPLEQAIRRQVGRVGVIGLGYVGLPLINAFVSAGFRTLGFDVDQRKVDTPERRPQLHQARRLDGRLEVAARRKLSRPRPTWPAWPKPTLC